MPTSFGSILCIEGSARPGSTEARGGARHLAQLLLYVISSEQLMPETESRLRQK